jgi:hypothetical protein
MLTGERAKGKISYLRRKKTRGWTAALPDFVRQKDTEKNSKDNLEKVWRKKDGGKEIGI